jgi:hypothetical protein
MKMPYGEEVSFSFHHGFLFVTKLVSVISVMYRVFNRAENFQRGQRR